MKLTEISAKTTPQLRFPHFSDKWTRDSFSKLFLFRPTNSFAREDLNYMGGEVRNIHYGDIHTKFEAAFDISKENVPFINKELSLKRTPEEDYLRVGDVVLADASEDYSDVGKAIEVVELNGEKALAGLHTILARPRWRTFAKGFLAYLLQSWKPRLQIMTFSQGTKVFSISRDWLSRIELDFPTWPEQQKIAAFLGVVDEKIRHLKNKKRLLLKYKTGVMQQIFDQKIRFTDVSGNYFSDWRVSDLGRLCKIYDGTHTTPDYKDSGIPFYSVEQVTSNDFANTKFIAEEVFEKENKRVILEKGDILMTRIGDIGTSKYISWDVEASFYVSLALIKKSSKINPVYLDQFMKSDIFQRELHRRTLHVAFPKKINLGEISKCKVLVPSPPEQEKIANFLTAIDARSELVGQECQKTKIFKEGLLQQMFV